jgi:hypothetical protein
MNPVLSSGSIPAKSTDHWQPGSCTGPAKALGGFLRTIELDAGEAVDHPDAFERLRAGDLQAMIVHGVYPQAMLDRLVERLERHDPPFLQTWFP